MDMLGPLLFLNSLCYVNGNPKTIFLRWDLLLQLLSPEHFKFFIFTEILSHELNKTAVRNPSRISARFLYL